MCGRYTQLMSWRELVELYRLTDDQPAINVPAHYNVAPSQQVPIVRLEDGKQHLAMVRWGLVPFWAKDLNIGYKMINARAETVAEKPSFRAAFRKRRCLVPASGFYEWKGPAGEKQPYYITLSDGPMTFAGLWESWKNPESGETVESCTIIVTQANELCARIHDRMPVILAPNDFDPWLYSNTEPEQLKALLEPYPAKAMTASPVSKSVGNVRNDEPALIEPLGPEPAGGPWPLETHT